MKFLFKDKSVFKKSSLNISGPLSFKNFARKKYGDNGNNNNEEVVISKDLFIEKKFLVIKNFKYKYWKELGLFYSISGLNVYLAYKVLSRLFTFRIFSSIFWCIPLGVCSIGRTAYAKNREKVIVSMSLFDDGKRIEVITMAGLLIADISQVRDLSSQEKVLYFAKYGKTMKGFYPVAISDEIYLLNSKSQIFNSEVMEAVKKGKYITVVTTGNIRKDQENNTIIDI